MHESFDEGTRGVRAHGQNENENDRGKKISMFMVNARAQKRCDGGREQLRRVPGHMNIIETALVAFYTAAILQLTFGEAEIIDWSSHATEVSDCVY